MPKITNVAVCLIIFNFFCFSCNTYQYYSLDGTLPKSQYSDFFFENDTLQVIYTFNGENGPVTTKIFNKTKKPIYVNWGQPSNSTNKSKASNLNDNDDFFNFPNEKDTLTDNYNTKTELIEAHSELITFHTYLNSQYIKGGRYKNYNITTRYTPDSKYPTHIKEYHFSENNSPIVYRNRIFYSDDPKNKKQHLINSKFWVTKMFKTNDKYIQQNPDMFKITRITNTGVTYAIVAILSFSFLATTVASIQAPPR